MKRDRSRRLLACALVALVAGAASALTEDQKIEKLIQTVGDMKDAVFIRNATEHTPAQAAQHMRNKWDHARDQVKTAEEFIDKIASKSSASGKPYRIRFKDGREVESGTFLHEELKKLNS